MRGLNVRVSKNGQDFAYQICAGLKCMETRDSDSLHLKHPERIYIIRTGCGKAHIIGECIIYPYAKHYKTKSEFDEDYNLHLINSNSDFYIMKEKYGYPITDAILYNKTIEVNCKGYVWRKF